MSFASAQPIYAEHGIITFPVSVNKRPAIRNFQKIGVEVTLELTEKPKLAGSPAIGFMTDGRNGITVLDIDTANDNILADALDRHGRAPSIARTGSGKFLAYYKHNGERRKIRPWRGLAIDLLGTGGFAVAPPSQVAKGEYCYCFIQGSLDHLDRLPVLRNIDLARPVQEGERNNKLWRHCMKAAHHVESFDELLDVARTYNDDCLPPMEDSEVITAAQSALGYTERGQNRFGQHGAWFPLDEVNRLIGDQDAAFLLIFLRAN